MIDRTKKKLIILLYFCTSPTYKSGDLLHPLGPGILVEQLQRLDQGEGEGPEAEGEDEEGLERLDGLRNEGEDDQGNDAADDEEVLAPRAVDDGPPGRKPRVGSPHPKPQPERRPPLGAVGDVLKVHPSHALGPRLKRRLPRFQLPDPTKRRLILVLPRRVVPVLSPHRGLLCLVP